MMQEIKLFTFGLIFLIGFHLAWSQVTDGAAIIKDDVTTKSPDESMYASLLNKKI